MMTDSPPTPLHPRANEETSRLPTGTIPQDLNPALYDEEEEEEEEDGDDNVGDRIDDSVGDNVVDNDGDNFVDNVGDDGDFEDVRLDMNTFTIPFDTAYELVKLDFENKNNGPQPPTTTSESQQSKFVNYLDEELLKVQRKFIKNVADMENRQLYSIFELSSDLSRLVDLIWYSVNDVQPLFGQGHYLIKMMNDLEDYVGHQNFTALVSTSRTASSILSKENNIKLIKFFNFLQALDVRLSFLIDGFQNKSTKKIEKLHSTEFIRLIAIASRLRILLISKLDPLRAKIVGIINAPNASLPIRQQANDLVNLFEVEIGRLFEGLLDRGN